MIKCPDCKGKLEKGCMIDHAYGAIIIQRYAKAEIPETSQKLFMGIHETNFNDVRRVITYRCVQCNRLFQYAQNFITVPNLVKKNTNVMIVSFGIAILIMILGLLTFFLFTK